MKTLLIACICSVALAVGLFAQTPTATSQAAIAASPVATVTASPSPAEKDDLETRIEKKLKKRFNLTIGDDDIKIDGDPVGAGVDAQDIPELVLPIVAVSLLTIFGAPVLIVGLIMYFGFSKNRMMHKTVRMMVEKGQPVPEALLNPPPHVRKRSDMRRGVVLIMVGLGLMLFFAAVNDWEGGAWSLGIIPFLIGAGYLLVWKLEGKGDVEGKRDNPPPLP